MRRSAYTLLGYLTWRFVWRERVRARLRHVALGGAVFALAAGLAFVAARRAA